MSERWLYAILGVLNACVIFDRIETNSLSWINGLNAAAMVMCCCKAAML